MRAFLNKALEKYKSLSVEAKAALWFTICNIIQKGISTITVPVFTRLMSPEQYGNYTVYLSWQSLLLIFTSLNLYYGVFNNAMVKFKDDRSRYVSSMQGLTFVVTGVFFAVYLLFQPYFNKLLGLSSLLVYLLFIQLFVNPPLLFWSARQRFEFRYKVLVGVTLTKAILNPLLGVVAVLMSENKDIARIASIVIVDLIIGVIIAFVQFKDGKCFIHKVYWKYAFFFNLPLLPHYLSGTILNQADRIMISNIVGTSEAAFYAVAYNIGMLMLLFTDAINNSFTPWMYIKMKEKEFSQIKKMGNSLVTLIAGLVVMLLFFAPEIIRVFAAEEYYDALYVIPPVAVTTFFIFVYVIFANIEFYYEENKMITIASISSAVLNLILNAIFIPMFGYYAAAYTTLVCYILYTFSHYLFSCVVFKYHESRTNLFDIKYIGMLSITLLIVMVISNFLYRWIVVRYVLVVFSLIIVITYRKKILSIISEMKSKA